MPSPSTLPPTPTAPITRLAYPLSDQSRSISEQELSSMLNKWSQEAEYTEGRLDVSHRILTCFKNKETSLDLSNFSLSSLPSCLVKLSELQHLDVSKNYLRNLPAGLSQLTKLQSIDIRGNEFKGVPRQTRLLPSLQLLSDTPPKSSSSSQSSDCNFSGLSRHEKWFEALNRITECAENQSKELDLSGLGLTELPMNLLELKHLEYLDLGNNQLENLPVELSELSNLKRLFLDENRLNDLPDAVHKLRNLTYLNLNQNQILKLPDNFWDTKAALKTLEMEYNNLLELPTPKTKQQRCKVEWMQFPMEFESLKPLNIHVLNLDGNQLDCLPADLRHFLALKELHLANNNLKYLPCNLKQVLPSLLVLDTSRNDELQGPVPDLPNSPSSSSVGSFDRQWRLA